MAGRRAEESMGVKGRFQTSQYAYVPCMALISQGMRAQKVTVFKPHLGSMLLKSEKRLALYAQLTYYKPNKLLDGKAGVVRIHACDASDARGMGVLAPCRLHCGDLPGGAFFVSYSGEREVRLAEKANMI
jgi:hypothetical protein